MIGDTYYLVPHSSFVLSVGILELREMKRPTTFIDSKKTWVGEEVCTLQWSAWQGGRIQMGEAAAGCPRRGRAEDWWDGGMETWIWV